MNNLAAKRKQVNLTQQELADKIGVTQKDISRYENGVRSPRIDIACRIMKTLNCTIEDLIDETLI